MNKDFYYVKRGASMISVHQGERVIGSIPRNAVIEISDEDGNFLIEASRMNDAVLVAYILERFDNE